MSLEVIDLTGDSDEEEEEEKGEKGEELDASMDSAEVLALRLSPGNGPIPSSSASSSGSETEMDDHDGQDEEDEEEEDSPDILHPHGGMDMLAPCTGTVAAACTRSVTIVPPTSTGAHSHALAAAHPSKRTETSLDMHDDAGYGTAVDSEEGEGEGVDDEVEESQALVLSSSSTTNAQVHEAEDGCGATGPSGGGVQHVTSTCVTVATPKLEDSQPVEPPPGCWDLHDTEVETEVEGDTLVEVQEEEMGVGSPCDTGETEQDGASESLALLSQSNSAVSSSSLRMGRKRSRPSATITSPSSSQDPTDAAESHPHSQRRHREGASQVSYSSQHSVSSTPSVPSPHLQGHRKRACRGLARSYAEPDTPPDEAFYDSVAAGINSDRRGHKGHDSSAQEGENGAGHEVEEEEGVEGLRADELIDIAPATKVRRSRIKSCRAQPIFHLGLFADEFIVRGRLVVQTTPERLVCVGCEEWDSLTADANVPHDAGFHLKGRVFYDEANFERLRTSAGKEAMDWYRINHGSRENQNLELLQQRRNGKLEALEFRARDNISKGSELRWNYGNPDPSWDE